MITRKSSMLSCISLIDRFLLSTSAPRSKQPPKRMKFPNFSSAAARISMKSNHPKTVLVNLCAKQKWPRPNVVSTQTGGTQHRPEFTARVELFVKGVPMEFDSTSSGHLRKDTAIEDASNVACKELKKQGVIGEDRSSVQSECQSPPDELPQSPRLEGDQKSGFTSLENGNTAADEGFDTLKKMASDFVRTYCPNLDDPTKPSSYILPRNFSPNGENSMSHHSAGEAAERLVYDAISELIDRGTGGPILAVHRLDLNSKQQSIRNLFPSLTDEEMESLKLCFRECDFFLIGPNIGLIVIEVKGSGLTTFSEGRVGYAKGLKQLASVDQLRHLLEHCVGFKIPASSVRKILCMPNWERSQCEEWFRRLTNEEQTEIRGTVGDFQQWFQEDLVNGSIFDKLCDEIEKSDHAIGWNEFQRCAWLVAFIKSLHTPKESQVPGRVQNKSATTKAGACSKFGKKCASKTTIEKKKKKSVSSISKKRKVDVERCAQVKKATGERKSAALALAKKPTRNGKNSSTIPSVQRTTINKTEKKVDSFKSKSTIATAVQPKRVRNRKTGSKGGVSAIRKSLGNVVALLKDIVNRMF